jgi:hypothetical protein
MATRKAPVARPSAKPATAMSGRPRPGRRRVPRPESIIVFDGNLTRVPLPKPAAAISCASSLTQKTGSIAKFHGAHTHTGPDYVVFMCPGFGFGGAVAVTYTKIADGFAFVGSHFFCWIKNCSNGAPSTSTTSVKGTVTTKTGVTTFEMSYEVLALCGTDIVCTEVGTFTGTKASPGLDPRNATFNGKLVWTVTCCPDVQWNASIAPV